jgi:hypothetical protein
MTRILCGALLFIVLVTSPTNIAQSLPDSALKPLAFLSGRWVSQEPNEIQEENWSPVIGGSIIGSFRVIHSGKPVFYEFWAVEIDGNQPVLKLKHFNFGLTGWEEKDASTRMPLTSSDLNDATFAELDGSVSLHYHRTGDTLSCTVHHVKNGKSSDESFNLKRTSGN